MNALLVIGIILLILWLLGYFTLPSLGWLVHVALILAVVLIIVWLLKKVFKIF